MTELNPAPGQAVIDPNATPAADAGATPTPEAGSGDTGAQPGNEQKTVPLAALHEEREKARSMRVELDALKANLANSFQNQQQNQHQYNPMQQQQQQQVQPNNQHQQLEQMWEQDPKRAVQTEIQMALQWYDKSNTQLDSQEDSLAGQHPDFNNYRSEVRKYLRTLSPNQRSQPGVVELAYYVVKGQKVDGLVEQSNQALIDKIKAGEQVQGFTGTVGSPAVPAKQVPLTHDQKNAAMAMGMTPDEYMKNVR